MASPVADEGFPEGEGVRGGIHAAVRAGRESHVHVVSEGQQLRLKQETSTQTNTHTNTQNAQNNDSMQQSISSAREKQAAGRAESMR